MTQHPSVPLCMLRVCLCVCVYTHRNAVEDMEHLANRWECLPLGWL